MENQKLKAHIFALITIFIWGSTFISTKLLLTDFTALEILLYRFIIGYLVLIFIYPQSYRPQSLRQELYLAAAGLTGITIYYLLENIALEYTYASNVGTLVSIAPLFTAVFAYYFLKNERPSKFFYIGFALAIYGVIIISFQSTNITINPKGDILCIIAAVSWGAYSIFCKKISNFGNINATLMTKRIFFYGILFILPIALFENWNWRGQHFADPLNLLNMLYLGVGASAICFTTWNWAIAELGAVKTSVYLYLTPIITVIASALVLNEPITKALVIGITLILVGLIVSELKKESHRDALIKINFDKERYLRSKEHR